MKLLAIFGEFLVKTFGDAIEKEIESQPKRITLKLSNATIILDCVVDLRIDNGPDNNNNHSC